MIGIVFWVIAAAAVAWLLFGPGEDPFMVAVVIGLASLFVGMFWLIEQECNRIGIQVERETEFFVVGGCFVTLKDGRSVPIDENSIGLFLEDRP